MTRRILLSCGILSSLFYIGMNIIVPGYFDGYSMASQTVSELSAIDAPTRLLWVVLAMFYILLFAAFGFGIWKPGVENRRFRIMGWLIMIYVGINFYWPPMHLRGHTPTLTDTLHIVWAVMTIILMMLIMGFGASSLGNWFRLYTIVTFLIFISFGLLIGTEASDIPKNLPTPRIGIWERINIGAFMLWIIILSIVLLLRERKTSF